MVISGPRSHCVWNSEGNARKLRNTSTDPNRTLQVGDNRNGGKWVVLLLTPVITRSRARTQVIEFGLRCTRRKASVFNPKYAIKPQFLQKLTPFGRNFDMSSKGNRPLKCRARGLRK